MKNRKTVQQIAHKMGSQKVKAPKASPLDDIEQDWSYANDDTDLSSLRYDYESDIDHRYFN